MSEDIDFKRETFKIFADQEVVTLDDVAESLHQLWLKGPRKSLTGVKSEHRKGYEFVGTEVATLKMIGNEIGRVGSKDIPRYIELPRILWKQYGREGRIVAAMILGKMSLRTPEYILPLCKELVASASSWEDCDQMTCGYEPIIRKMPFIYLNEIKPWVKDENKWVRRSAITTIGRVPMKEAEFTGKCLKLIEPCLTDPDRDVRRAMSFAIRLSARGDLIKVKNFLLRYIGNPDPSIIWILSDVIRSMAKKLLPQFIDLLLAYEDWMVMTEAGRSRKSLEAAVRCLHEG